jgi:hypothetical protein
MFLSIVGTQQYGIVTVKHWTARPAMPTLATSRMLGRRLNAGRKPPAGFLRSELDDVYQSACAVGAIVSLADSAGIRRDHLGFTLRDRLWKGEERIPAVGSGACPGSRSKCEST